MVIIWDGVALIDLGGGGNNLTFKVVLKGDTFRLGGVGGGNYLLSLAVSNGVEASRWKPYRSGRELYPIPHPYHIPRDGMDVISQ